MLAMHMQGPVLTFKRSMNITQAFIQWRVQDFVKRAANSTPLP